MGLNGTYNEVRIDKSLLNAFPIQNGSIQGGDLSP
jgi:hypothetical protein